MTEKWVTDSSCPDLTLRVFKMPHPLCPPTYRQNVCSAACHAQAAISLEKGAQNAKNNARASRVAADALHTLIARARAHTYTPRAAISSRYASRQSGCGRGPSELGTMARAIRVQSMCRLANSHVPAHALHVPAHTRCKQGPPRPYSSVHAPVPCPA